jgi:hypothetical protein
VRRRSISNSEALVAGVIGPTAIRARSGANKHKGSVEAVVSELAVLVVILFVILAVALV